MLPRAGGEGWEEHGRKRTTVGSGINPERLPPCTAAMNPKREGGEGTHVLRDVAEFNRIKRTGIHADGVAAGMNWRGVGEIIRRPTEVRPAVLE